MEGDLEINANTAALIQWARYEGLLIWTVTTGTSDHGERFVARPHQATGNHAGPLPYYLIADSLDQLRAVLPPMLTRLERDPGDDPVIVETWL